MKLIEHKPVDMHMEIKITPAGFTSQMETEELTRRLKNHPDYPLIIIADPDGGCCAARDVSFEEILDCVSNFWERGEICLDRDIFENVARDKIRYILKKDLDFIREPTQEEIEKAWKEVKVAHEPYWKKCIVIWDE